MPTPHVVGRRNDARGSGSSHHRRRPQTTPACSTWIRPSAAGLDERTDGDAIAADAAIRPTGAAAEQPTDEPTAEPRSDPAGGLADDERPPTLRPER